MTSILGRSHFNLLRHLKWAVRTMQAALNVSFYFVLLLSLHAWEKSPAWGAMVSKQPWGSIAPAERCNTIGLYKIIRAATLIARDQCITQSPLMHSALYNALHNAMYTIHNNTHIAMHSIIQYTMQLDNIQYNTIQLYIANFLHTMQLYKVLHKCIIQYNYKLYNAYQAMHDYTYIAVHSIIYYIMEL